MLSQLENVSKLSTENAKMPVDLDFKIEFAKPFLYIFGPSIWIAVFAAPYALRLALEFFLVTPSYFS